MVDALSVHAAVTASNVKTPAELSLVVHIRRVRSLLDSGVLSKIVRADTRDMLADAMTKGAVDREAIHAAMDGVWVIQQSMRIWGSPLAARVSAV